MQDAVIVSAVRTPVGKAPKGALRFTRPDELAALVVREALARAGDVRADDIDDVDPRLRDARGRTGPERRPHRQPARRPAGDGLGGHRQPLLRLGPAGDRQRRRPHPRRRGPGHRGRRHRVDEPGADGRPQGGAQSRRWSSAIPTSTSRPVWSPRTTRASRASRARRRTPSRCARTSGRWPPSTPAGSPTRSSPSRRARSKPTAQRRAGHARDRLRGRRGAAPRHLRRGPGRAGAGVPRRPARSRPATRRRRATGRQRWSSSRPTTPASTA